MVEVLAPPLTRFRTFERICETVAPPPAGSGDGGCSGDGGRGARVPHGHVGIGQCVGEIRVLTVVVRAEGREHGNGGGVIAIGDVDAGDLVGGSGRCGSSRAVAEHVSASSTGGEGEGRRQECEAHEK